MLRTRTEGDEDSLTTLVDRSQTEIEQQYLAVR